MGKFTVTAAATVGSTGDLFELTCGTGRKITLLSSFIGQYSDAGASEAEMLAATLKWVSTAGSGGTTSLTAIPHQKAGAASTASFRAFATTDSTPVSNTGWGESFNGQAGLFYQPTENEYFELFGGDACVWKLDLQSPADDISLIIRNTYFEEIV